MDGDKIELKKINVRPTLNSSSMKKKKKKKNKKNKKKKELILILKFLLIKSKF